MCEGMDGKAVREGMDGKVVQEYFGGDGNVLYHDCISVNTPVVILDYSFAMYCYWEKLCKWYGVLSVLFFLQLRVNLQLS